MGCRWQAAFWLMALGLAAASRGRVTVSRHFQHRNAVDQSSRAIQAAPSSSRPAQLAKHDKWIVVTTINYPTDTIKKLAVAPGWKLVVVADLKTPKDWALDNVDFISVEDQKNLQYEILPLLPNNHYGRKNLGYLWAIEHGAKTVYETDDDNILKVDEPQSMQGMDFYVFSSTGAAHVCNPYSFFGLPNIWPRGYPLDQIKAPECTAFTRQPVKPLILQGLADVDPDVDAIYRLTQKLGVNFAADTASVVLPEGVMCPWNSQNTLFEREALWGLLIPVTTTFRVCDIWRSYWVQRLLWEVGGALAFGPPTVDQFRNAHTLLHDFLDELDLYNRTGPLVQLLHGWKPAPGADLPGMMVDLAQTMAGAGMWAQGDADLMAAWVRDLGRVGYAFPEARPAAADAARLGGAQSAPAPAGQLPRTPQSWRRHRDIVLVLVFNSPFPGWLDVARALREAYLPIFSRIVYTGHDASPAALQAAEAFVPCHGASGNLQYACFANVMQEVPAPPDGGYLIIGDDTLFSHCQLAAFNASKVWFQRAVTGKRENLAAWLDVVEKVPDHQHWRFNRTDVSAVNAILEGFCTGPMKNRFGRRVRAKLGADLAEAHFGGDFTDGLYIPARLAADFQLAAVPFRQHAIQHEIAIPAILGVITDGVDDFEVFKPLYFWDNQVRAVDPFMGRLRLMEKPDRVLVPEGLAGNAFLLHPYKIGQEKVPGAFWSWWQNTSCSPGDALPQDWPGTIGFGAEDWADMVENRGAHYNNVF